MHETMRTAVVFLIVLTLATACQKQVVVLDISVPNAPVGLRVDASRPGLRIPEDFSGLSFETNTLTGPYLVSANEALVRMVRLLGKQPVIRVGGTSADAVFWADRARNGAANVDSLYTDDLVRLFEFARTVNGKVILDLNFAQVPATVSASEAAYALAAGDTTLAAFEIGNAPDFYDSTGLKPVPYTSQEFLTQWLEYYTDIHTLTQGQAYFAGPSTTNTDGNGWLTAFLAADKSRICQVTQHYYRMDTSDQAVTIGHLLEPDQLYLSQVTEAIASCRTSALPFRVDECNAVMHGGKKGVSNSFGSALWALDLMYSLSGLGVSGINFHGDLSGYGNPVQLSDKGATAEPLFYGLLAFQVGSKGTLVPVDIYNPGGVNLTAYAVLGDSGNIAVTVINKNKTTNANVVIHTGHTLSYAGYIALTAGSQSSTTGVTLGGNSVKADGQFVQPSYTSMPHGADSTIITVPYSSAMIISLR